MALYKQLEYVLEVRRNRVAVDAHVRLEIAPQQSELLLLLLGLGNLATHDFLDLLPQLNALVEDDIDVFDDYCDVDIFCHFKASDHVHELASIVD